MANTPVILIIYNHADEREKDQLLNHLYVLKAAGLAELSLLSDEQINTRIDRDTTITQAIAKAKVILLLITSNFLTEEFLLDIEMFTLIENRRIEGGIIIPMIAKPCAWQVIDWFSKFQVRPKTGRPVWHDKGSHADTDLAVIAKELAYMLQRRENPPISPVRTQVGSQQVTKKPPWWKRLFRG
jgi:hypothetical protein